MTMKLYYAPGACSLSPHIVACEAGLELTLEKVDLKAKKTASGGDYLAVNPKGYVPALQLDDGQVLTEGSAIIQYLADLKPAAGLAPANGSWERYRLQEWLGYITSELHKSFGPLFNPAISAEARAERIAYLNRRYALVDASLEGKSYLLGEHFSVADAYLFVVTSWARIVKLDLGVFPNLVKFQERVAARPGVKAAMVAEGLIAA
jgi:glutathione S-transferase